MKGEYLSNTELQGKGKQESRRRGELQEKWGNKSVQGPKASGRPGAVFTQELIKGLSDAFQRSMGDFVPAKPDSGDNGTFRVWLCLLVSGCSAVSKRSSQQKLRVSRAMRESWRCPGSRPQASRRAALCDVGLPTGSFSHLEFSFLLL